MNFHRGQFFYLRRETGSFRTNRKRHASGPTDLSSPVVNLRPHDGGRQPDEFVFLQQLLNLSGIAHGNGESEYGSH